MSTPAQVVCPDCGRQVDRPGAAQMLFCPYCNARLKPSSHTPEAPACPRCHSAHHTKKAGDAYREDQIELLAPPDKHMQSRLPTSQPSNLSVSCQFLLLALLFIAPGFLCTYLSTWPALKLRQPLALAGFVGPFLILLGLAFALCSALSQWSTSSGRVSAREARPQRPLDLWNSLYYCSRHDGVFIPGETALIPLEKIQDFLETY